MNEQTKKIIYITGISLIVIGISVAVYLYFNKDKDESKERKLFNRNDKDSPDDLLNNSLGGSSSSSGNSGNSTSNNTEPSDSEQTQDPFKVYPQFNAENELKNPYSQLKGHYLYPKRKEQKGQGYANIRSSAEVNTDQGWWDPSDNLITTINSGIPIGKVIGESNGLFNGYSYRWFKVKLNKPVGIIWKTYEGFVRADTVTFKPYDV